MAFKNPLTNMFEKKTERYTRLTAEVDQQDTDAQAEDSRAVVALADALASDAPDPDLIAALRAKRKTLAETREELRVVRGHYVVELAKAQQEEFEKAHAAELVEQRKASLTRKASVAARAGEIKRQLVGIPELLAQLHERLTLAEEEVAKAELITGAPFLGVDGVASLLRRAVKAAALEDWLREPVYEADQSPIEALSTELDARLDAAMESFDYTLGLKTYVAPEPTAAEIAAQEEAERAAAAAAGGEEHQRRLATDPAYVKSHFPETGVAFVPPGTEAAMSARREAERSDGEAIRRIKSQGF